MNYLLSLLLLDVVSHAHAAGSLSPTSWKNLIADHGISILITVLGLTVFYTLKYIITFIWRHGVSDQWNTMKSDVGKLKTTVESDVGKMKEDIHALQTDVGELQTDVGVIKKDIRNIKDSINKIIRKFLPKEEFLIERDSPLRITDAGKNIATKIDADKLLTKHWEYLKDKVDATNPRNAYDIEIASVEVARDMDVVLSDEDKYIIKEEAYSRGIPHEEILSIIGVMLRDKLLEERESAELKKIQDIIAKYDGDIRLNPKNYKAYINRGLAKQNLGKFQDALCDYDEAIRLDVECSVVSVAYYNHGNVKSVLGKFQDAISDYDEAIRLNPEYSVAYNNRGNAKNELSEFQDAINDYNEAIRLNPEYSAAYHNRGNAKSYLNKFQDAISDYDEAIRLNPKNPFAYHNRGVAKSKLGDKEGALADFTKAKELNPGLEIPDLQPNL